MTKLHKGCIGDLISDRSSLTKELEKKLKAITACETEIKASLLDGLEPHLIEWLVEDAVISSIFKYGKCTTSIRFNSDGFKNLESVRETIKKLEANWKGLIHIELDSQPEPHRIKIKFTVIM